MRLVTGTETGGYDGDGVWVNSAQNSVVITGHFTAPNREEDESELSRTRVGVIDDGDLDFYTETPLVKDSIIEVDQNNIVGDDVRSYRILAVTKKHDLMAHYTGAPPRYQAHVREVPI